MMDKMQRVAERVVIWFAMIWKQRRQRRTFLFCIDDDDAVAGGGVYRYRTRLWW